MQHDFFKKKKRAVSKVTNIECIKQDISRNEQDFNSKISIENTKQTITNEVCLKRKEQKSFKSLEDFSFISENSKNIASRPFEADRSFVVDNIKVISNSEKKEERSLFSKEKNQNTFDASIENINERLNIADSKCLGTSNDAEDANLFRTSSISSFNFENKNITEIKTDESNLEMRRIRIMNNPTRSVDIKYSLSSAALFLPQDLKQLSILFKILASVHSFNQKRGLTLIFVKYIDSIERLFKHRVEMEMLERLNYICKESIVFAPLTIFDQGERKETFIVDFKGNFDIDIALFNFLLEEYGKWLDRENIKGKINKFHPDFLKENISIPRKAFLNTIDSSSKDQESSMNIKEIVKSKSKDILERIKEKERLRKEQFIKECTIEKDYEGRIESLFAVSNKKALKLDDIVLNIGGFNCKSHILKSFNDKFFIKKINGVDFVVKKSSSADEHQGL